jgi:hypothetical protein
VRVLPLPGASIGIGVSSACSLVKNRYRLIEHDFFNQVADYF